MRQHRVVVLPKQPDKPVHNRRVVVLVPERRRTVRHLLRHRRRLRRPFDKDDLQVLKLLQPASLPDAVSQPSDPSPDEKAKQQPDQQALVKNDEPAQLRLKPFVYGCLLQPKRRRVRRKLCHPLVPPVGQQLHAQQDGRKV